jgi:hypothetical protein
MIRTGVAEEKRVVGKEGAGYHPKLSLIRFIVRVVMISVIIASPACLIVRRASKGSVGVLSSHTASVVRPSAS